MEQLTTQLPTMMDALEKGNALGPMIVYAEQMNSIIGLHTDKKNGKEMSIRPSDEDDEEEEDEDDEVEVKEDDNEEEEDDNEEEEDDNEEDDNEEEEDDNEEDDDEEEKKNEEKKDEKNQPPRKKQKVERSGIQCCKVLSEALQKLANERDDHMEVGYGTIQTIRIKVGDRVFDPITLSLKEWKEMAEPAPFGNLVENTTVYDESVRKALQIKHFEVISMTNTRNEKKLEAMFSRCFQDVFRDIQQLKLIPHAINIYEEGGHFARHVDSQRYPTMVGTLNLLMGDYKGGKFIVQHPTKSSNKLVVGCPDEGKIYAVVLRATCPHEVTPVKSGMRVSITFDVCGIMNHDEKHIQLLSIVDDVLAAFPDKTHVGITLQHLYSAQDVERKTFRSAFDETLVRLAGGRGRLLSLIWKQDLSWDANEDDENNVNANYVSTLNQEDAVTYANALFFSGAEEDVGFRAQYHHQRSAEHCGNESLPGETKATYLVTILMIGR